MNLFPKKQYVNDIKIFKRLKKFTQKNKHAKRPVEDIDRSLSVVQFVLDEAYDYRIQYHTVTWALKFMQEDPTLDISTAIVMGLEKYLK